MKTTRGDCAAQLEQYQNTVAELDNIEKSDRQKTGQSQAELQRMRDQIASAQQQLGETRKAAAGRNRSYAVVPYEGPNQTRRRPIYLECRADAVILQPEGIRLTEADFDGPMGPSNPLAAALRAAREYMSAAQEFDPQAGEPYPLLLVRPEGIGAYYAAREAMKSWGCDFGYELVGNDWTLAYQQPDPRLANVVREAIASARVTQERLIAAAPRQYARRSKPVYPASRSGGFVRENGGSDDDDEDGYRSATPAGPGGRNGGAGPGGRGVATYGSPGHGGAGSGGFGGSGGPGNGAGNEYNPYVAATERPGTAVPGGGVPGISSGSSGGVSSNASPAPGTPDGNRLVGGQTGGGPGGMPSNGVAGGMGSGTGGGGDGGSMAGGGGSDNPIRGGAGDGTANAYVTMPDRSATTVSDRGSYPSTNSPRAPSGTYANPSANGASRSGAPSATSDRFNASEQNNGEAIQRPEGYVVGQPGRESTVPPTSSPPSSDGLARGQPLRPGEWEPTPEPPPKMLEDKKDDRSGEKKPHKTPKSLAERRGEDWGLRDAARGSVGVTRPIRIECYADRLVVLSDRNPADNKVVPLGPRTASSIDTFINCGLGAHRGLGDCRPRHVLASGVASCRGPRRRRAFRRPGGAARRQRYDCEEKVVAVGSRQWAVGIRSTQCCEVNC